MRGSIPTTTCRPSPRHALLIECGQHWSRAAVEVAIDTLVRLLQLTGPVDDAWAAASTRLPLPIAQDGEHIWRSP